MNTDPTPAGNTPGSREGLPPELLALPAPRHLQEYLTRSQHLHFGYFESPADPLPHAQDRLVQRNLRLLPRKALVADVGCGLGGTVNLLAVHGHRVYGLDPCQRSIAFARTRLAAGAQVMVADMREFAGRARGARFDALFLVQVLAHFPDLGTLLGQCRSVLRPGGLLFVHEIVRTMEGSGNRSHPARVALRSASDAHGFDSIENRVVTNRTLPTLARLTQLLAERREELLRVFAPTRPAIAREIADYEAELRELERAFAHREVAFESSVLRCSTRLGTDSVVLRVQPRVEVSPARREKTRETPLETP